MTKPNPAKAKEIQAKLHGMVGMERVANQFDGLLDTAIVNQRRKEAGLPVESDSNHLIFTGSPGTGKTTVARELGKAYHALGILPTDKFQHVERADLVAGYVGQTAIKTREAFNKAKGGVLFVDEAYTLANDDYGKEALTQLMTDMENNRDDTVVIFAGYPKEMQKFVAANPGLKSRLPKTLGFDNYKSDDMDKIARGMFREGKYTWAPGTGAKVKEAVNNIAGTPGHGNARDVRTLYQEVRHAQSRRIAGDENARLERITPEDVDEAVKAMKLSKPVPGRRKARLKRVA